MTASGRGWDVRVCEMCEAGTRRWVYWQQASGEHHYFCDNDCLTQWIIRSRAIVCAEVVRDCQSLRGW